MGPVDVITDEPGYIPAGYLKISNVTFEMHSLPLSGKVFNPGNSGYAVNQQDYVPLFYSNSLKMTDTPNYLFPDVNFNPPIDHTLLKPGFQLNPNLSTGGSL
jgi:hypothetical protein